MSEFDITAVPVANRVNCISAAEEIFSSVVCVGWSQFWEPSADDDVTTIIRNIRESPSSLAKTASPSDVQAAMHSLKIIACVLLVAMALGGAESAQPMCYTPEV